MSIVTIPSASTPPVAWTPNLTFGGAAVGMTYAGRTGIYIKFGSLVFFKLDIQLSAKGSSTGLASISLPFAGAGDGHCGVSVGFADAMSSISGGLSAIAVASSAALQIDQLGTGTLAVLTNANFTNTTRLIISGVYSV
jgi:hypothetical protein